MNARPFSAAQPRLHLRLDGGARLAAAAWVTPRPSVVIRRHRLRRVTLADLVDAGHADAGRRLVPVGGGQGPQVASWSPGRRGPGRPPWCGRCAPRSRRMRRSAPSRPSTSCTCTSCRTSIRSCIAWEARPGSGERGPDGRQAGEFTLDEALYDSFRFNLSRQIVGEVRGQEMLAMIKAMESGAGSISTTHAADAEAALRKLVTCAMEAGAARHPRLRHPGDRGRPSTSSSSSTWRPPRCRTALRSGTGGCRRSSPSPRASGRRATPPPTSSARPATAGRRRRACCPTSTASWRGTASTCTASSPTPARWRR